MKRLLFLSIILLFGFASFAQLQQLPGYGQKATRFRALNFLGLPVTDTICDLVVNGTNGDCVGAVVYRTVGGDTTLYIKNVVRWQRVGSSPTPTIPTWDQVTTAGNISGNRTNVTGATGTGRTGLSSSWNGSAATLESWNATSGLAANLYINPDGGFVGIGTTTPGYELDVSGTINGDQGFFSGGIVAGQSTFTGQINGVAATMSNRVPILSQVIDSINIMTFDSLVKKDHTTSHDSIVIRPPLNTRAVYAAITNGTAPSVFQALNGARSFNVTVSPTTSSMTMAGGTGATITLNGSSNSTITMSGTTGNLNMAGSTSSRITAGAGGLDIRNSSNTQTNLISATGTMTGAPATASDMFVTSQQVTDTITNRLSLLPAPTLQQVTTAGNSSDRFVRFTGVNGITGAGPGLELFTDANPESFVQAYNRTTAAYIPLNLSASITKVSSRMLVNGSSDDGTSAVQVNGVVKTNNRFSATDGSINALLTLDGGGAAIGAYSNHALNVYTNSIERMRIAASGEVGIGITPISGTKFTVNGQTRISDATQDNSVQFIPQDNATSTIIQAGNAAASVAKDLALQSFGGNVGIGVTNPLNKLVLPNAAGAIAWKNSAGTSEDAAIYVDGSDKLHLYNGGSIRASILTNGNMGVGTTTPATPLEVNGTITAPTLTSPSGDDLLTYANGAPGGAVGRWTTQGLGIGGVPAGTHSEKLLVAGNILSTDAYVLENSGTGTIGEFFLDGDDIGVRATTNHHVNLYSNNTLRVRIQAGGGVKYSTSLVMPQRTVSANTTLTLDDHTIFVNANSVQLNILTGSAMAGTIYRIVNPTYTGVTSTVAIYNNGVPSGNIPAGAKWTIQHDGGNWILIGD